MLAGVFPIPLDDSMAQMAVLYMTILGICSATPLRSLSNRKY